VKLECAAAGLALPNISIEPGRNIVGPTTFTLYEVGTVKDVVLEDGGTRRYISVDGGMSDNIRTSLYDAQYFAVLADRPSQATLTLSRVVGKHCETGDIVIRDIQLPSDIAPGDLLATPATGAYGRSMASNYNHVPRPPVVAIKNGKARVIVRRENEADLLALDVKE
jgi:diaminopimelate decarboxylase